MNGTGGHGTGSGNWGVLINGTISTTGNGNLSVIGTAGSGSSNDWGVRINTALTSGGAVTITGTGTGGQPQRRRPPWRQRYGQRCRYPQRQRGWRR